MSVTNVVVIGVIIRVTVVNNSNDKKYNCIIT